MTRPVALLAAVLGLPAVAPAQGFVESVAPPAVERGKTARVTFHGKEFGPTVGLWHSLPAGALTAVPVDSRPDRLTLDVTAAADAPVGLCGLRVATRDGLTNAVPFLVDDLPVRPRGDADGPVSLARPAAVWGSLRAETVDRYTIAVTAGETVSFEAVANRFGKDADPLVTIRDAAGRWVVERDNDPGLYFDCRFAHTFAAAGTYTVEVRDARFDGSEHHRYVLRVGRFPAARVAVPSSLAPGVSDVRLPEAGDAAVPVTVPAGRPPGPFLAAVKRPGDDGSAWLPVDADPAPCVVGRDPDAGTETGYAQATAPVATLAFALSPFRGNPLLALDRHPALGRRQAVTAFAPVVLSGVLRRPGGWHSYLFPLAKGDRLFVRGEAKPLNSPADLELILTDRTGRELRRHADPKPNRDDVTLEFSAPAAGEYVLMVRDQLRGGSPAHAYRLTVRPDPFPPELSAEVEGLTVPQGTYQPVPILVTRYGPPTPIRLTLVGGPPGLRLTPAEVPADQPGVVCRLEADASAPLGVYTVHILAESPGPRGPERSLVTTRPLIDRRRVNVDLIPYALRDDQTRPPPSLTDRFAVQVTPPTPYTFELPEPTVTLLRYKTASVPVVTTRAAGFDGPITFAAVGGQLAPKQEGRTRVYAEFPPATATTPAVSGVVVSKILSNTAKARIDVTAVGTHAGRRVSLTRTFDLDLVPAFRLLDPVAPPVALLPGESGTARLRVERRPGFAGPVTVTLNPAGALALPESVTVPAGADAADVPVTAGPGINPGRVRVSATAAGEVAGYQEEVRGTAVEVEVRKPEGKK